MLNVSAHTHCFIRKSLLLGHEEEVERRNIAVKKHNVTVLHMEVISLYNCDYFYRRYKLKI